MKKTTFAGLPDIPRALIKAAPALFLSGLCFYLAEYLVAAGFLLCAIGDVLLDIPEEKAPLAFEFGAGVSAIAADQGAAKEGAVMDGVATFIIPKKGLMASAAVGGQHLDF